MFVCHLCSGSSLVSTRVRDVLRLNAEPQTLCEKFASSSDVSESSVVFVAPMGDGFWIFFRLGSKVKEGWVVEKRENWCYSGVIDETNLKE